MEKSNMEINVMKFFIKYFLITSLVIYLLILMGCAQNKEASTLHNYPYFKGMDCPQEFSVNNEDDLKAQAKALNMRYVDYLHLVNNKKYETTLVLGK